MVSNINYIFFVYFFRGLVQQVIKNLFSEHYIHVTIVYLHPCPHQVISASFEREREREEVWLWDIFQITPLAKPRLPG